MLRIFVFICLLTAGTILLNAKKDDYLKQGQKALSQKKFDEATKLLTKAIESNDKDVNAYMLRAQALVYSNRFHESIIDLSKVISLDSSISDAYNLRGLSYGYVEEIDNAIADFSKAIQLDPKFAEAYLNRGSAHAISGNNEKALKDLDKAISLDPKNPESYYQRGRVHYNMDNLNSCIDDLSKSLSMGINLPDLFYARGNAYFKLKDYQNAVKDYTKAIQLDPNDTQSRNNRALAYDGLGDKEKAQADRDYLNKLAGNRFAPIESIKWKKYSDAKNSFSIELPENWNFLIDTAESNSDVYVTFENIKSPQEAYTVGAKLSMNRNVRAIYNLPPDMNLIDFWQGSISENIKEYYDYRVFIKKSKRIGDFEGYINKVGMIISKGSVPLRIYELVFTKGDDIFFGYLQAPEVQFAYYEQIFEKAIQSLRIN